MQPKYSLTYTGVIVVVIGYLFNLAGVPFAQEEMEGVISFLTTFAGVVMSLYGRWRTGDLTIFGFRKKKENYQ